MAPNTPELSKGGVKEVDEKKLLISLLASLTFSDHIGDVLRDAKRVLKELGVEDAWYNQQELAEVLKENFEDVETLYGTEI